MRCQALCFDWFFNHTESCECPDPGSRYHQYAPDIYGLSHDAATEHAQNGWRKCGSCRQLFHMSNPGKCAGGRNHIDGGGDYYVYHSPSGDPPVLGQPGWKYCTGCSRLFFAAGGGGVCPAAGGGPHTGASSHYVVPKLPFPEAPVVVTGGKIDVSITVANWDPAVIATWDQAGNWTTAACRLLIDTGAPPNGSWGPDGGEYRTITHNGQRLTWTFSPPGSGWGVGSSVFVELRYPNGKWSTAVLQPIKIVASR